MSYALLLLCITTLSKSVSIGDQCYLLCNETALKSLILRPCVATKQPLPSWKRETACFNFSFESLNLVIDPKSWVNPWCSNPPHNVGTLSWISPISILDLNPRSEVIFVTDITVYICGEKLSCGEIWEHFGENWEIMSSDSKMPNCADVFVWPQYASLLMWLPCRLWMIYSPLTNMLVPPTLFTAYK